jgi:hypothetical protein
LLSENANPDNIISGFKDFYSTHIENKTEEIKIEAHLQNITDIHLHSNKLREIEANSNMSVIYTLAVASLILLFIAITNYSNLNIGMADFSDKFLFISKMWGSATWMNLKRRTKEIGLRKINGAKISELMLMLNWDFIKWILISFLIAIPFAFFVMDKWLENFAYKPPLSWWIFALAGLSAIIIAILTVSVQSWKASNRNPVETLRYE